MTIHNKTYKIGLIMESFFFIALLVFIPQAFSEKLNLSFYNKVIKEISHTKKIKIKDHIPPGQSNTELHKAFAKNNKLIGFIRHVSTSTGCNDGCLPIIFTLFYDKNGSFIALRSREGLTKKNHTEFTEDDYFQLDLILRRNPKSFSTIPHPKFMVDGITRATKKHLVPDVVKLAAYSTFRINSYHQETKKIIRNLLKK